MKGDIEKYWPAAIVVENAGSDYRFRAILPRFDVLNAVAKMIHDIDYPDFKASIADRRRSPWYGRIWANAADMQDHFELLEE